MTAAAFLFAMMLVVIKINGVGEIAQWDAVWIVSPLWIRMSWLVGASMAQSLSGFND